MWGNVVGSISVDGVPGSSDAVIGVIFLVVKLIIIAGFLAAFILLMLGGIGWIISGGDEKSVAKAKGRITAALIGLIILISSIAIMQLVGYFFNVNVLQFSLPQA